MKVETATATVSPHHISCMAFKHLYIGSQSERVETAPLSKTHYVNANYNRRGHGWPIRREWKRWTS